MIKFFCKGCGKPMWTLAEWEDIKHLTLEDAEAELECSDCILKEIHGEIISWQQTNCK